MRLLCLFAAATAFALGGTPTTIGAEPVAAKITVEEVRGDVLAAAIAKHKDKVVVVDLWATWCTSCVKKFPHFVDLHKKYADKGLVCVSVSMDRLTPTTYKKDAIVAFLNKKQAAFPNYIVLEPEDDEKSLGKLLTEDYRLIPLMVIFDKAGRRTWTSGDGPQLSDAELDKKIEELLAK
jgi:thiol-disulfide isomerase/thioredoxin